MSTEPKGARTDPSMQPTKVSALVIAALVAAAAGWLLLSFFYNEWPSPPWFPVVVLAVLAVAEGFAAQNTAARVQRKPGAPRVEPLAVARYAVLAKASSMAGSLYGGYCAGMLLYLAFQPTRFARESIPATAGGVIAAVALVAMALWLERACRIPDAPDKDEPEDPDIPRDHF